MLRKGHYTEDMRGILSNLTFLPPTLMMIAAGLALATAINIKSFIAETRQNMSETQVTGSAMAVIRKPIVGDELIRIKDSLALEYPDIHVKVSSDKTRIEISASGLEQYKDWMDAVVSIQSYGNGSAVWKATDLCMRKCEQAPLFASIQGAIQSLEGGSI